MKKRIRCFSNGRGSWAFAEVEQGEKRRTPYMELWSLDEIAESAVNLYLGAYNEIKDQIQEPCRLTAEDFESMRPVITSTWVASGGSGGSGSNY